MVYYGAQAIADIHLAPTTQGWVLVIVKHPAVIEMYILRWAAAIGYRGTCRKIAGESAIKKSNMLRSLGWCIAGIVPRDYTSIKHYIAAVSCPEAIAHIGARIPMRLAVNNSRRHVKIDILIRPTAIAHLAF